MKLQVGLLSMLLVSSLAFAHDYETSGRGRHGRHHKHVKKQVSMYGDYNGRGSWKSADGTKGTWTMTSTVTKGKDTADIKEVTEIKMEDGTTKSITMEWSAKHTGNGFFEVQKAGTKIGTGYCHAKRCHFEGEDADGSWEETMAFAGGRVYRMGSHTSKDATVAWSGVSVKKQEKKDKGGKGGDKGEVKPDPTPAPTPAPTPTPTPTPTPEENN